MFCLECAALIAFGTDGGRRHTSVCRGHIYIDRAMPEHIARALVGVWYSASCRGNSACARPDIEPTRHLAYYLDVVLQPASHNSP
jgi:hypothetical protein